MKKLLSLLVVLTMVIGVFSVSSFAAFSDVKTDASYAEATDVLSALEMLKGYEDGSFKPEGDITRAEFAAVVCRILGLEAAANGAKGATAFKDVPADDWAAGYINLATQAGIIKGYGNGMFGPKDTVKYEQAIKMVVAALGYTPKAEAMGGYPTGYLTIAAQKDITKGTTGVAGVAANRATVARIAYNALSVDLMEQTSFGKDPEFSEQVGKTLLSEKLKVTKVEGILTDNNDDEPSASKKTFTIGSTAYKAGNVNSSDLLGYKVVAYVKDKGTSDETTLALAPQAGENETLKVSYDDIKNISVSGSVYYFNYEVNDEDEDVEIEKTPVIFYNGVKKTVDITATNSGYVTLINNDDDDAYDVAYVVEYKDYIVDEVVNDKKVSTNDGTFEFDAEKDDYNFAIMMDGKAVAVKDLKKDDVLSILMDGTTVGNSDLIKVYVTRNVVTGTVEEESDEDITVAGKKLKFSGNTSALVDLGDVATGDEGKFFLNLEGKIAQIDTTTSKDVEKIGYVFSSDVVTGLENKIQFKVFTAKGVWVTLDTKSTFDVDNVSRTVGTVATVVYDDTSVANAFNGKVISWKVDSSNKVKEVTTEAALTVVEKYNESTKTFGTNDVSKSAIIHIDGVTSDEDNYSLITTASFEDDKIYTTAPQEIKAYGIDDDEPLLLVAKNITQSVEEKTPFFVVTSKSSTTNAAGDDVFKIYGYENGDTSKEVSFTTTDDVAVSKVVYSAGAFASSSDVIENIVKGSVIQYRLDGNKNVDNIKKYDIPTGDIAYTAYLDDTYFAKGLVTDKKTGNKVVVGGRTFDLSKANFYEIDASNSNKVTSADIGDIEKNVTKVYIRYFDGAVTDVIILTPAN